MVQQRQQRRRGSGGGGLRLVAVLLMALAVLSLCLARADAVAAAASSSPAGARPASLFSEHGVATALENALAQEEEVSRGHSTASTAAAEEGQGDGGAVVLERAAMESTEDYSLLPSANSRHVPHP